MAGNIELAHNARGRGVVNVVIYIRDAVGDTNYSAFKGRRLFAAGMGDYAVADLPGEIESLTAFFNSVNNAQALFIVSEAVFADLVERSLTRVTEGGVSEVVSEGYRFCQIFIEFKRAGYCSRNLRHLKRVGKSCAVIVAFGRQKDLRFVFETAEGAGVNYSVAVALVRRSYCAFFLKGLSALCLIRKSRKR